MSLYFQVSLECGGTAEIARALFDNRRRAINQTPEPVSRIIPMVNSLRGKRVKKSDLSATTTKARSSLSRLRKDFAESAAASIEIKISSKLDRLGSQKAQFTGE